MPNGGYPRHMLLRPRRLDAYVVHFEEATLRLVRAEDWDRSGSRATPELILDADEVEKIVRHASYWLEEHPLRQTSAHPDVRYDY